MKKIFKHLPRYIKYPNKRIVEITCCFQCPHNEYLDCLSKTPGERCKIMDKMIYSFNMETDSITKKTFPEWCPLKYE